MEECVFCRIVRKEIPADICYEDERIMAFKDINPVAPVHILVIPKVHIPSLNELAPGDAELLGHMAGAIKKIAADAGVAASGYRVVINNGQDSGQLVHHIHAHVIGGKALGPLG